MAAPMLGPHWGRRSGSGPQLGQSRPVRGDSVSARWTSLRCPLRVRPLPLGAEVQGSPLLMLVRQSGHSKTDLPPASPPGLQGGQATPGELQATNRRDLCLVPGEQGRRPLGPPPRAHLPPPPAGPSRPGQGVRLLGGAHSPPGPSVHSGQGPCPLVLGSQPDRQMGLAGRGKSKTPPSWAPHHPGCGSELAVPRGPRRPGRTCPGRKEGLCPECGQLQAGGQAP